MLDVTEKVTRHRLLRSAAISCRRGSRGALRGVCPAARPAAACSRLSAPAAASRPAAAAAPVVRGERG